jgi:hypothetical protein
MTQESPASPSQGDARASANSGSQAIAAGGNVSIDQSRHWHDSGQDSDAIPLVRRISAEDVPGFVGRADELRRLARLLAPGAPRGGPLVLCPENDQAGIGVTALAVQAASRAVAAGCFPGGAVLVRPHPGGEQRQLALPRTMANVLAALGIPPEQWTGGPGGEQAAYQRAMDALAADGKPVLIVIEEVWETDARLVDGLAGGGPHRMLLTAWEPQAWMINPRRLLVRYLNEDESVEVLSTALAPDSSGTIRPPDSPAHLRALARHCLGIAQVLRTAADQLAAHPELSIASLLQALADAHDRAADGAAAPDKQPRDLTRALATMTKLLAPVWRPLSKPDAGDRRVIIGRRALLSWVAADHASGQPSAWDVVAGPGAGKSTLLAAAAAMLAARGARVIAITMEVPVDNYQRRAAGSSNPLVIELARTQLCMDVVRAAGEKLTDAERLAIEQLIYRADQVIQELLATRPRNQPDLNVVDLLIPRGTRGTASPLGRAVSKDYAAGVRAVRMELGRLAAVILRRPAAGNAGLAALIDNLHLVTDAACRQWLASLFYDQLGAVTVVTRRPGDQYFCDAAVTYHLRDFTRAETLDYLTLVGRIDPQSVDDEMLDAIMNEMHGTPQAVAILCDELTGRVKDTISDAVGEAAYRSLAHSARNLVARACQEVLGRDLPIVLDFLVVLRHVNAALLRRVLASEGVTRDQAADLAARLGSYYSIMTSSDDADEESFRLHERIRRHFLEEMPSDTQRERHARAEQIYAGLIAGYEPEWDPQAGDAFTVWARFESPEFQALLREWFFHAMRSQGKHLSPQTGVRITQIFLEAFWWWGWYLRFSVCDQVLRDFALISADKSEADREWLADLSTFYRNYRLGYVYNQPGESQRDWAEVGPALLRVRGRVGLKKGKAMDPRQHAIDVITDVYRAQSVAFRDPGGDPDVAAELFAEARAAARRSVADGNEGHRWYDAWIVYFTTDMWSACGRLDEAVAGLHELDALAAVDVDIDLFDRDLVSRTTSLQGDVYLAQGDYARAIDACARAALLVYAYHVRQETIEQPPNEYTYERHAEAIARAQECLTKVRAHSPDAWRAGIQRMCATFAPYWRLAGGPEAGQFIPPASLSPADWPPADSPALPPGIVPPLPDRSYLGKRDSPFTDLARRLVDELEPLLNNLLPFQDPELPSFQGPDPE